MIDRRALVDEIVRALAEHPDLRDKLRRAISVDNIAGQRLETVAERAARTRVGASTLRAAIREGRLEVVRVGRAVRVPIEAVVIPRSGERALSRAEWKLGLATGRMT
ncbi:MAG TPA: excisionase family DNA-binding protein [Kofleriaceae bacterium]|jgi:excisionase family DNA binding protein